MNTYATPSQHARADRNRRCIDKTIIVLMMGVLVVMVAVLVIQAVSHDPAAEVAPPFCTKCIE